MRDEERPCACIEKGAHRFLQLSIPRLGRARSRSLVQLGDPIAPRAEQESPAHRRSRRHSAMVRYQDCQRPHRGHQQPRSGREGQSAWLSLTAQSHRDHLLDRGQNRPQVGHLRQRIPVFGVDRDRAPLLMELYAPTIEFYLVGPRVPQWR
jgi:hypothetical protein